MNHLRSDSGSNGLTAKESSPLLGNRPILIFSAMRFTREYPEAVGPNVALRASTRISDARPCRCISRRQAHFPAAALQLQRFLRDHETAHQGREEYFRCIPS